MHAHCLVYAAEIGTQLEYLFLINFLKKRKGFLSHWPWSLPLGVAGLVPKGSPTQMGSSKKKHFVQKIYACKSEGKN